MFHLCQDARLNRSCQQWNAAASMQIYGWIDRDVKIKIELVIEIEAGIEIETEIEQREIGIEIDIYIYIDTNIDTQ